MTDTEILHDYSINDLSTKTGVNSVTIRAWERRYGLLKPVRNSKGHRYYSDADIETVKSILVWLDRGVAISKVKPLLGENHQTAPANKSDESHWDQLVKEMIDSASSFKCMKLNQQMNDIFSSYPIETLAQNFFTKLFDQLDKRSGTQFGGMAEKNFVETEISFRLQSQIHHQNLNNQGSHVLFVVLGKDERKYKILLFALAMIEAGYRLNILLDGCELREIPIVVEKTSAEAVVCYSDIKLADIHEISRAAAHARIPFFVTGHCMDIHPELHHMEGITTLKNTLRHAMQTIHKKLAVNNHV